MQETDRSVMPPGFGFLSWQCHNKR